MQSYEAQRRRDGFDLARNLFAVVMKKQMFYDQNLLEPETSAQLARP